MPRWQVLARRARRSSPLIADIALALVLTILSVLTVEDSRQIPGTELDHAGSSLSAPPPGLDPGEPWDAEITVRNPAESLASGEPRLVVVDRATGASTSYAMIPAGAPGVYRARVVFPADGVYSYEVFGGFQASVAVGEAAGSGAGSKPVLDPPSDEPFPAWPALLAALTTLPLALRRRAPVSVLAVALAATLALDFAYHFFNPIGALIAVYAAAAHVGRPRSIALGIATALGLVVLVAGGSEEGRLEKLGVYAIFGAAWLLGDSLRTRRAYLRELEERAQRLEREREANARRAAAEEQARIARELHDIIAHNVSVMTVQAAAAGDAFDTRPERVREALGSIEATGREALTELRRLLGRARPGDGPGAFDPQPGLARLDALVDQVRAAGLAVGVTLEGPLEELPPGVDLSVYRIVQEALTNTLRHANASTAGLRIRSDGELLEVDVFDDGHGSAPAAGYGNGIIGMTERAALLGGELSVGPRSEGGFAVRARIPLGEEES